MIATLDAGLAWAPYLNGDHTGFVLAEFRKAVYLQFSTDVLALVASGVPNGPLHLRLSRLPLCKIGDVVELHRAANGSMQFRSSGDVVEFDRPQVWMPPTIDGARLRQIRPALPGAARSDLAGSAK